MNFAGFFLCLLSIHSANSFEALFKHLTPKPGGIIDSLTKPKIPGFHKEGGLSFGIGPFGMSFGFKKQYVPGGINVPPKEPLVPDGSPYVPGYPDGKPYVPGVKPERPYGNPYVPGVKPVRPSVPEVKPPLTWEEEEEKEPYYPRPNKDDKDHSKPESFEEREKDGKNPGMYESGHPKREDKDSMPDWEDIGEEKPKKAENFMDSDLVGDGLIHPRLNRNRNKRFIESRIYHVPILFQSNGKPSWVKFENHINSLDKHDF